MEIDRAIHVFIRLPKALVFREKSASESTILFPARTNMWHLGFVPKPLFI